MPLSDTEIEVQVPRSSDYLETIAKVKKVFEDIGKWDFRLVANVRNDKPAMDAVQSQCNSQDYFDLASKSVHNGEFPPPPVLNEAKSLGYTWYHLAPNVALDFGLAPESPGKSSGVKFLEQSKGCILQLNTSNSAEGPAAAAAMEYFLLCRNPPGLYYEVHTTWNWISDIQSDRTKDGISISFRLFLNGEFLFDELCSFETPMKRPQYAALLLDGRVFCSLDLDKDSKVRYPLPGYFSRSGADRISSYLSKPSLRLPFNATPIRETEVAPQIAQKLPPSS
jgi:hypothetical protein